MANITRKLSDNDLARQVATKARVVIKGLSVIAPKMIELRELIDELRERFRAKPRDEKIWGCRTWTEFCENKLGRRVRTIRYLLAGGNNDGWDAGWDAEGEKISPAPKAKPVPAQPVTEEPIVDNEPVKEPEPEAPPRPTYKPPVPGEPWSMPTPAPKPVVDEHEEALKVQQERRRKGVRKNFPETEGMDNPTIDAWIAEKFDNPTVLRKAAQTTLPSETHEDGMQVPLALGGSNPTVSLQDSEPEVPLETEYEVGDIVVIMKGTTLFKLGLVVKISDKNVYVNHEGDPNGEGGTFHKSRMRAWNLSLICKASDDDKSRYSYDEYRTEDGEPQHEPAEDVKAVEPEVAAAVAELPTALVEAAKEEFEHPAPAPRNDDAPAESDTMRLRRELARLDGVQHMELKTSTTISNVESTMNRWDLLLYGCSKSALEKIRAALCESN